jgi:pimeloyl-ACP methyl ester carboxylesterase
MELFNRSTAVLLTVAACLLVPCAQAATAPHLPRKAGSKNEAYPGVAVLYDAIRDADGHWLRMIATHPEHPRGRVPAIFVVGWLSCDSVEAPPGTTDASQLMMQAMAKLPGFATVRLDKAGVGDSQGDCARTDFTAELAAYRQAFGHLKDYAFIDPERIFLFGMSNGGGFAPLVADGAAVKGYVVMGGWTKTWFEHMLEIERRRLTLLGHAPAEMNALMKGVEALYSEYLLEGRAPAEIFAQQPDLRRLWDGPLEQQYGRPVAYYQQLQRLDLMAAWSSVRVPVLAMHGEYDWIMSRNDFELLAEIVNGQAPGLARFVELPQTGHTFEHYASLAGAFEGKQLPFDESLAQLVGDWLLRQQ